MAQNRPQHASQMTQMGDQKWTNKRPKNPDVTGSFFDIFMETAQSGG